MDALLAVLSVILSVGSVVIFLLAVYSGKLLKRLAVNALLGFAALGAILLTSGFTGVTVHINPITVVGTAVFSVPAVIGFLLLNLILGF